MPGSPIVLSGVRAINNAAEANCIPSLEHTRMPPCLAQYKSLMAIAAKSLKCVEELKSWKNKGLFALPRKKVKLFFLSQKIGAKKTKVYLPFRAKWGGVPLKIRDGARQ